MLCRWDTRIEDINLFIGQLKSLVKRFVRYKKKGRGTNPKRSVSSYISLVIIKEYDKKSLRGAEARLSRLICKERVDHSVISYWENKEDVLLAIQRIIGIAGSILDRLLSRLFSFVDSTKFVNWHIEETEIFVCNRIADKTVYPIGISFLRKTVASPVNEAVPNGSGNLYADAWFDDNDTMGVLFSKGYTPIICPNKNRWRGYYRKKARKLYRMFKNRLGYRQRGRGESLFGSLTDAYGDRLKAINSIAMKVRIASRMLTYQIKLLLRATLKILSIVRHAQLKIRFKWIV